jgi:hypothetical protein
MGGNEKGVKRGEKTILFQKSRLVVGKKFSHFAEA